MQIRVHDSGQDDYLLTSLDYLGLNENDENFIVNDGKAEEESIISQDSVKSEVIGNIEMFQIQEGNDKHGCVPVNDMKEGLSLRTSVPVNSTPQLPTNTPAITHIQVETKMMKRRILP